MEWTILKQLTYLSKSIKKKSAPHNKLVQLLTNVKAMFRDRLGFGIMLDVDVISCKSLKTTATNIDLRKFDCLLVAIALLAQHPSFADGVLAMEWTIQQKLTYLSRSIKKESAPHKKLVQLLSNVKGMFRDRLVCIDDVKHDSKPQPITKQRFDVAQQLHFQQLHFVFCGGPISS
ncbi:BZ3500_MvSof-1268-A1-R1_Chr9g10722 [Microbotryum saponariae]|uniref:BZ3500_MvSof-1268-A1-R1_Chr9g10722 protein n=1 Tax=Microbotryum saponariae TaxID=289078 RepID=A0A2X0LVL4_9BASI|nr:BZ3501_MvSof-1269-A2-R1_Chr9g10470 [Microbotryum saponariae]SDA00585.1 BZ3500_MvSof-1268-A1-R1_Chr9g10722 [Microbotryum saponariae]